jgi:hypothetical protein
VNPGPLRSVGRLESPNLLVALQGQCDLIETLEQPGTPAWINLEGVSLA